MALPEQIRKQVEAVQEMYKQTPNDNTGAPENAADGTVLSAPPTADENPAPTAETPPAEDEHKSGGDSAPEETVLQKYRTLQGMYNAEVPRLHQQNRELSQRLQQFEQLLSTMSAQQKPAEQPQQERFISDKDVEEYGESIDVMRRVTRDELVSVAQRLAMIEQQLSQVQTNIVPQVQAVAQRQHVSAEQQFWADLGSAVPNFREINGDADFQTWLLEADPLTGITRQTYLEDAQRGLDARRVASIFRAWTDLTGQATIAQSTNRAATSELEKQVAPGRSRGTGAPTQPKGRTYTPQDIQKFFNDVRAGKYKGREQERDKIERDIFAAQRENRIQMNA